MTGVRRASGGQLEAARFKAAELLRELAQHVEDGRIYGLIVAAADTSAGGYDVVTVLTEKISVPGVLGPLLTSVTAKIHQMTLDQIALMKQEDAEGDAPKGALQ